MIPIIGRGFDGIDKVIDIDQSPIGRTPRSNPAVPLERSERGRSVSAANGVGVCEAAHRHLRHDPRLPRLVGELFAMTPDAKMRGYKNGRFSFSEGEARRSRSSGNVKGGRCVEDSDDRRGVSR